MRKGSRSEDLSCPNALVRWLAGSALRGVRISSGLVCFLRIVIPTGAEAPAVSYMDRNGSGNKNRSRARTWGTGQYTAVSHSKTWFRYWVV